MSLNRRPRVLLVLSGLVILAAAFFPAWYLVPYAADVHSTDSIPENETVLEYDELTPREQTAVETALDQDGSITMYGPLGAHENADSELPFSDRWLDDGLGAYVSYGEDEYLFTYDPHATPIYLPLIVVPGALAGASLVGFDAVVQRSVSHEWETTYWWWKKPYPRYLFVLVVLVGLATLVVLGWIGNVDSYLRPIQ